MGKVMRVVVGGSKGCGKTGIVEQLALCVGPSEGAYEATLEDTYTVTVEGEKGGRDSLVFHDTGGLGGDGPTELRRPYLLLADALLLVFDLTDSESFNRLDLLKKALDRHAAKEKKDIPIFVFATKADLVDKRAVDAAFVQSWAQREKVKLFEVSAKDRSTLVDPVLQLVHRLQHPQKESKFTLPKRGKDKTGAAIVMDI